MKTYGKLFLSGIILFVLASLSLISSVWASSIMWSQTYGSGIALSLVETSDGGYAMAGITNGNFCLVKTDAYGNLEWNHTYGEGTAHSLVETSDNGYAIAGGNQLVKTDEYGNVEWNRTFSRDARSLIVTSDGGFAIAGSSGSLTDEESDFWLVKTDAQGNVELNKTYGGADMEVANWLVETSDGGYAMAGDCTGLEGGVPGFYPFDNTLWLVKTDGSGNMEWNQSYGEKGGFKEANSLVESSDGGYAIAGYIPDAFGHDDFWLIKTDALGNMEWNRTYGGYGTEHASCLVVTSDGGYALTGFTSGQSYIDALLVKTDAYGNMEWNQTYGGTGDEQAFSMVESSDGGFALSGCTTSVYAGPADFWLVKTDGYGNIPEFPSGIILPLFVMATTAAITCRKIITHAH
jgi:hypothetical protein